MLSFLKKHRLVVDAVMLILAVVVFIFFLNDALDIGKRLKWMGAIVFGAMAIIKLTDVVDDIKKRENMR